MAKKLQEAVSDVPKKVQASLANSKVLNKDSVWVRFDPPLPGMILAEDLGAAEISSSTKTRWRRYRMVKSMI